MTLQTQYEQEIKPFSLSKYGKGTLVDHQNMTRDVSNVGHWGNDDYEVKIKKPLDMGYKLSLIRQSYDKN